MKFKSRLLFVVLFILLAGGGIFYLLTSDDGASQQPQARTSSALGGPKVALEAGDNTLITARPYLVKDAKNGAVIIHDIGKNRAETMQFAEELAKACGCSTIAIDLRGHGQSEGSKDFNKMYLDAEVAGKYLQDEGVQTISYIGFGFGAYAALKAGIDTNAPAIVLVSPNKDDKGLKSTELITQYNGRLLIAASKTDGDSNRMASKLFNLSKVSDRQFAEYASGGHGIRMVYDTDLGKIIRDWLQPGP